MRGFRLAHSAVFLSLTLALVLVVGGLPNATGDEVGLKPARAVSGSSLTDHAVRQLERLPWEADVIYFNLGRDRPVSISACYLMEKDLLVVSSAGRVYCLSRRNGKARWVSSLRHRLAKPPTEGGGHYAFLTKDLQGASWIEAFSKRSGAAADRFPRKLPYAAASGIASASGMVYVPSLGRPGHNKTLETVNLLTGRSGWGFSGTSLILGGAQTDPKGDTVIFAGDDGIVTSLNASSQAPKEENWSVQVSGAVDSGLAVTPDHVVLATHDGLVYCLDVRSGERLWLKGADNPFRKRAPWVLGRTATVNKSAGVEGAADVKVEQYTGIAFARNMDGLHAFDLTTGTPLFTDKSGGRPVSMYGKWVVTVNGKGQLVLRDSTDGYKVKGTMNVRMLELMPTNRAGGEIYAVTNDGGVVISIPKLKR